MKKATFLLFSWFFAVDCFAGVCKYSEAGLLGDWKAASRGAPFQVMSIENEGEGKVFNSWLHEKPELLGGSWTYVNCVLRISHATDKDLSYEFVVVSATKNTLVLRELDSKGGVRYRRIVEIKR